MKQRTLLLVFFLIAVWLWGLVESDDQVTSLPGWGELQQPHYSGLLPVNHTSSLFYWYIPSEKVDASTVIWLNGGPGCSSMVGGFVELGPFHIVPSNTTEESEFPYTLQPNEYSWNKVANLLIVDQPIGTGYSTVDSSKDFVSNEEQIAEEFYSGLCQFFKLHPDFAPSRNQPLFIAGESYAGKYIPAISTRILQGGDYRTSDGSHAGCISLFLSGIAIGDGLVDPYYQRTAYPEQAYANAFIGQYQRKQAESIALRCQRELLLGNTAADPITEQHTCDDIAAFIYAAAGTFSEYDIRSWYGPYNKTMVNDYMNQPEVREAFHVAHSNQVFITCNHTVKEHLMDDIYVAQVNTVASLLNDYPSLTVLFYNGQFDLRDGPIGTSKWLREMNWGGKLAFANAPRVQWELEGEPVEGRTIGGYVQSALGLTSLTIIGAGHFVPKDQPRAALQMINTVIQQTPFVVINETEINGLCSFVQDCSGAQGICVSGRCVCNTGFAGMDCSYAIHSWMLSTENSLSSFSHTDILLPLTFEYFSFNLATESVLNIELDAGPGFELYMLDGYAPSLDEFSFISRTKAPFSRRSLVLRENPGEWYLGVYNGGSTTVEYTLAVNITSNPVINDSQTQEESSNGQHSNDLQGEKSNLVWAVSVLSLLLVFLFVVAVIAVLLLVKKPKNESNPTNWQNWQSDDL